MVRTIEPIVVEVDGGRTNPNLFFQPLEKPIRGRFGFIRTGIPDAMRLAQKFNGADIPGQEIRIDPDSGTAAILEPLHRPEHRAIKERIEKDGAIVPPPETEFKDVHVPTWLFWLKRAVDSKLARIVSGSVPKDIGTPKLARAYRLSEDTGDQTTDRISRLEKELADLRAAIAKRRHRAALPDVQTTGKHTVPASASQHCALSFARNVTPTRARAERVMECKRCHRYFVRQVVHSQPKYCSYVCLKEIRRRSATGYGAIRHRKNCRDDGVDSRGLERTRRNDSERGKIPISALKCQKCMTM